MNITLSIFPKFYKHLKLEELPQFIREMDLDTMNLVIRDGYWVAMSTLRQDLPRFMQTMEKAGLRVYFSTAGFMPQDLLKDPTPLALLSEFGITDFRMGYFRAPADVDPRAAFDDARRQMEMLVPLCQRYRIRAVYQVHHGTLIPSPTSAYFLVKGLPADAVSVEIDPGNQVFEGFENFDRSLRLLGEYCTAVGVKDVAYLRDESRLGEPDKGWKRPWVPIDEGVVNWLDLLKALKTTSFRGTFVYMPFYDEKDTDQMTRKLKREVAYMRKLIAQTIES